MRFRIFAVLNLLLLLLSSTAAAVDFVYNGFLSSNLSLSGIADLTSNGLLRLTNGTALQKGQAFYPRPVTFHNNSSSALISFSTSFVFAIVPQFPALSIHGIAFVIAPTPGLPWGMPTQYLGLFNQTNNGNSTNHVVAVELDTAQNKEFGDIDDNHVGIDINGLRSEVAASAGYYDEDGHLRNLTLTSGQPMQVWVEYDGLERKMEVTLAPINRPKPRTPLLSLVRDLSSIINDYDEMYLGFSSSTGAIPTSHYILGWSFKTNGRAEDLSISRLPRLPRVRSQKISQLLTIGLPLIAASLVLIAISGVAFYISRKRKFADEVVEDWELLYGPHRFKYKDLYIATKGFSQEELLGSGGFGKVYHGVLRACKTEIAVKRVSHESRQGMKEFVAEIVSIGCLRHRNLVRLLGYCRRRGELLLVYDYMPNGSLDKYLHGDKPNATLDWRKRFKVINGVAAALFYLHEEWECVVIHRDVKASNILLDDEFNARLGDFGLARLYDHGTDPQTTHIVGTLGYLAPEHAITGKATPATDVFAFGAFLLEVATGRRPISPPTEEDAVVLADWVHSCWCRGDILEAKDPLMGSDYVTEEVELVLKLGLLCSQSEPRARPTMRQSVQFLGGDLPFLGVPSPAGLAFDHPHGSHGFGPSYSSSSVEESLLSGGR
ncbi:hypothetical protein DM860_012187 [Cuscuta australis]|uniref:non-specific serine/threonine protein kinase n=1 Tax=Cuscuta australis TaxID=267555 RepID=A0A328E6N0_9ASTE|nr:hypothetical protein DM860_012187 [Cuscuta australis]